MKFIGLVLTLGIVGGMLYMNVKQDDSPGETPQASEQQQVLPGIEALQQARDAVEMVEQNYEDTMQVETENLSVGEEPIIEDDQDTMQEMESVAPIATNDSVTTMLVAGGCFWCVEADLEKLPGVLEVVSGYAEGTNDNPTYGNYAQNGHREVAEVSYNPMVISFEEILIYALKHMDPTDADGMFGDRGNYYSSAFYYDTQAQKTLIENLIAEVDEKGPYDKPLAVEVIARPTFWKAEEFHQDYYKRTLSSLKYKFYRNASGRDAFIEKNWPEDTSASFAWRGDVTSSNEGPWNNFEKPADSELQSLLTDIQYKVTQKNATERSYSNDYWDNHETGIYVDIVSGEPLFSSTHKFDSGTGWPSFTRPIDFNLVTEHDDYVLLQKRTEIRSAIADSHLGHVFNDAPAELGGIRYCMNSASLRFVAKADMEEEGYGTYLYLFE